MSEKQVLQQLSKDTLKQDLGSGPDDAAPKNLPSKLVTTRKPDEAALPTTDSNPSTQAAPWRAKARRCACGNCEADDGAGVATQNVSGSKAGFAPAGRFLGFFLVFLGVRFGA